MLVSGLLSWLTTTQYLFTLIGQNWVSEVLIVAGIVFIETRLVICPFLPGDSLLFATGSLLGVSGISPVWAMLLISSAAILGDGVNFAIGRSLAGEWLLRRGWIKPRHIRQTHDYFDRFGASTITIGRFIPVVRTAAPFFAGISGMNPRRFVLYNVLGALLWCPVLLMAGYWLGGIHWVQTHLGWLSAGIVIASLIPILVQALKKRSPLASPW